MQAPEHLSHKPIVAVAEYHLTDGIYSQSTDAKALSMGKAQWDETDLSLKVWRMVDDSWSRQSEELPVHRALDLTILALAGFLNSPETRFSCSVLGERIVAPSDLKMICAYWKEHHEVIIARIKEIQRLAELLLIKQHTPPDVNYPQNAG